MTSRDPDRTKPRALAVALGIALAAPALPAAAQAGNRAAGRRKAQPCVVCHGPIGISQAPDTPHVAGQPEIYVVAELKAYRSGKRVHAEMNVVAKPLTDADIDDLAAWYASIKLSAQAPAAAPKQGRKGRSVRPRRPPAAQAPRGTWLDDRDVGCPAAAADASRAGPPGRAAHRLWPGSPCPRSRGGSPDCSCLALRRRHHSTASSISPPATSPITAAMSPANTTTTCVRATVDTTMGAL